MTDENPELLDPIAFARFLLLPGAGRLLEAFGQIPPGPLRDSVITHAEVIASTYTGAPPKHRMADPVKTLATVSPPRLPSPKTVTGRAPPPINEEDSRDDQIIKLRQEGMAPGQIAKALGMHISGVYKVCAAAKAAGVPLPNKRAAPGANESKSAYHLTVDTMSPQAKATSERAALERGISLDDYLTRRRVALEMAKAGSDYPAILEATGEKDEKVVSAWLSNARKAGHNVPYIGGYGETPAAAPEAAQEPDNVVPMGKPPRTAVDPSKGLIFGILADHSQSALTTMQRTADKRGLTLQAYVNLREDIARKALAGWKPAQIAKDVGQDMQFCRDIIRAAAQRGVKFPSRKEAAA